MSEERPKLRPLDIIPVQAHGEQRFLLRDPRRISSHELLLAPDTAYLVGQFDGTRTIREAQVNYVRQFGTLLTTDAIRDLLGRLDEALFLDSERFRQWQADLEAEFRARPTRPAAHAGRSYEEGAGAFVGAWRARIESAQPPAGFELDGRRPLLVAPHYDMGAAAESYAAAYGLLARGEAPEVAVVLGIAHSEGTTPFALTEKPFETPFGALEVDPEIAGRLKEAAPFDVFADEFLHRDEHSIEFQVALLHLLYYEESDPPKIVPILCGAYHRGDGGFVDPAEVGNASRFLDFLRDILAGEGRRVAVIAAADLSHVGARFGQPPPLSQAHLDMARRHDMAVLERTQAGDAQGLYELIAGEQDRYNVCGFPAIYALLRCVEVEDGRLLSYRQSVEPSTESCVSFASVGLR